MATSYSNQGGTGARCGYFAITTTLSITGPIWHLADGDKTSNNQLFFANQAVAGLEIKFALESARVIDEAKFYQENTTSHGTWKWQGSNNGSSWSDIGNSFTLGGVATQTQTELNGNTTAYSYYRLLGVSGNASSSPWIYEFEFKIDPLPARSTSYGNTLGEGNRSASITTTTTHTLGGGAITTLVNGDLIEQTLWFGNNVAVSGDEVKFDFGSGVSKVITEACWFQNNGTTNGTWKWQGSNDGSNWTDIGSSFVLAGAVEHRITSLNGNTTGYRYYRMFGVSGTTSSSPFLYEIAFQIGDPVLRVGQILQMFQ